jgi:hypothetical protein
MVKQDCIADGFDGNFSPYKLGTELHPMMVGGIEGVWYETAYEGMDGAPRRVLGLAWIRDGVQYSVAGDNIAESSVHFTLETLLAIAESLTPVAP